MLFIDVSADCLELGYKICDVPACTTGAPEERSDVHSKHGVDRAALASCCLGANFDTPTELAEPTHVYDVSVEALSLTPCIDYGLHCTVLAVVRANGRHMERQSHMSDLSRLNCLTRPT